MLWLYSSALMAPRNKSCAWYDDDGHSEAECAFCGKIHRVNSLGHEAITLAYIAGVELDEWQQIDLVEIMRVDADGAWVYTVVAICISRQNGKGEILQARELYGVVVLGERILHTAHQVTTSKRAFERAESVVKNSELDDSVESYRYANGEQQMEFVGGAGLFYRARTDNAGRGIDDINVMVYDEAQDLTAEQLSATSSTTAVAEHQQKIYLGSGGKAKSEPWHEMREDGLRAAGGGTGRIVGTDGDGSIWIEYTAETITIKDDPERSIEVVKPERTLETNHALANPAYPHRIRPKFLRDELKVFKTDPAKFDREHLGCWDPRPAKAGAKQTKLLATAWEDGTDAESAIASGLVLAVAVGWQLTRCAVAAGGRRGDGARHTELLRIDPGTAWLEDYLVELFKKKGNRPKAVGYDAAGPARALKPVLERVCASHKIELVALSGTDYAAGCEAFAKAKNRKESRHLPRDPVTPNALAQASVRALGKGWIWDWETTDNDVSPIAAQTIADWLAERQPARKSAYANSKRPLLVV